MSGESIVSIFLGIGLASSAGFRVFLPLFALSLAAHNGLWELNDSWQWMGSLTAVITFGVATVAGLDPDFTWTLAISAGGGTATAIKGAAAGGRMASTLSTGGLANPVVATEETGTAAVMSLASIVAPLLAAVLVIVVLALVYRVYRKLRPRS